MLIDSAKGVEAQTRKLFEVCRRRGIPIFTFVNKLDRLGREPLELLDEVEEVLGIRTYPITWPIGRATGFRGVFDRLRRDAAVRADSTTDASLRCSPRATTSPASRPLGAERVATLRTSSSCSTARAIRSTRRVARGELSPMFFGSA